VGDAGAVLAGGAEEYCDFVHAALASHNFISARPGEPYAGEDRPSFLSEGAAIVLLEDEGALPRGARPLAEVAGMGSSRARDDRAGGGPSGARAVETAVRRALETSGLEAAAVDLIVSSASGGEGDAAEAEGLARAFSSRDRRAPCPVAACKAALGEGFAFSSALEALVAVKALLEQVIPPTLGSAEPALLPRPFVLHRTATPARLRNALAVSLNRRGAAVAVVFGAV
jgi:3-oxoacyl-[acyl-carrier-protein] synthase II